MTTEEHPHHHHHMTDEEKAKSSQHQQRGKWSSHMEFFLTVLGMAVGMMNVWRFPYITYALGGGAFLIPYVLAMIFIGLPLVFQEMAIGQYAKAGSNKVYANMVPIFKGLAYAILYRVFVGINYFCIVMSWCIYYLAAGMTSHLPWDTCEEDWNTRDCYSQDYNAQCNQTEQVYWNFECSRKQDYCQAHGFATWNAEYDVCLSADPSADPVPVAAAVGQFSVSTAEDYFNGKVLGITKDENGTIYTWEDYGSIRWELALGMLLTYMLTTLVLIRGVRSIGKASYFITIFPYVTLTVLLIYGLTLPGASDGIDFYLSADWSLLGDSDIWLAACIQISMSLGIGLGMHMALATYNDGDEKILVDASAVSVLNSATSFYAGFVVFAMTGFLAHETGSPVQSVVSQGISLTFVSYPEAMLGMWAPPLWNFLFFAMFFMLCLGSLAGGSQMIMAFILDEWPSLLQHRFKVLIVFQITLYLFGLPLTCNGGVHLFTLLDSRGTIGNLWCCISQTVAIAWIYGIRNFLRDIEEMNLWMPRGMKYVWALLWTIVTPGALLYMYIYSIVDITPVRYGAYEYPDYIQFLGLIMILLPVLIMAVYALYFMGYAMYHKWSLEEFFTKAFKPTEHWWKLREEKFAIQVESDDDSSSVGTASSDKL